MSRDVRLAFYKFRSSQTHCNREPLRSPGQSALILVRIFTLARASTKTVHACKDVKSQCRYLSVTFYNCNMVL